MFSVEKWGKVAWLLDLAGGKVLKTEVDNPVGCTHFSTSYPHFSTWERGVRLRGRLRTFFVKKVLKNLKKAFIAKNCRFWKKDHFFFFSENVSFREEISLKILKKLSF